MAPATLFRRLLDDAAVFPPGLAPVQVAVAEFRERARGQYADLIGPLLIGTGAVGDLIDALAADRSRGVATDTPPLPVSLIARPGTPFPVLAEAVARVRTEAAGSVSITGVELAHSPGWHTALEWDLPLAVEVAQVPETAFGELTDIATAAAAGLPVRAKLRTQSTPDQPVPDPALLGMFLLWGVRHHLPFKLTGGLHHAVPTDVALPGGGTERQHGLLNVLLATELADAAVHGPDPRGPDAEGASLPERVIATLTETDATYLAQRTAELTEDRARVLRSHFTSYGCCGVLDPIGELTALGLLSDPPPAPDDPPTTDDEDA